MQALLISYIVNVILMIAFLSQFGPRIISYIKEKKNLRETLREQGRKEEIHKVVRQYLKELQND